MSELSKKKIIGLTGSMGSGKSQVSKYISKFYPVLDCDRVNATLLERSNRGYEALLQQNLVQLDEDLNIDKVQLAKDMFASETIKQKVESILHPLIFEEMNRWIHQQTSNFVFIEMPILFESDAQSYFDSIWCVVVDEKVALDRLQTYRHISKEDALARLKTQMSPQEKMKRSNVIIENNGTLEELQEKVHILLERMVL